MLKRDASIVFLAAITLAAGAGQVGYHFGRRSVAPTALPPKQVMQTPAMQTDASLLSGLLAVDVGSEMGEPLTSADCDVRRRLTLQRLSTTELIEGIDRLLDQPPQPQRDRDLRLALELLARHDPSAALNLAGREMNRPMRTLLVAGVVTGWMSLDPAAALGWVAGAGEPEWIDAAFEQLAQIEPQRALQLAEALPLDNRDFRWNAFRAVVQGQLAEGRYADARKVIDRADDPALRIFLAAALADAWARYQPQAAAEWAAALPESTERGRIFVNVGSIWAAQRPHEAAGFAAKLPPGESRQQMLTHALLEWVGSDLAAASRWVDRLEPYPENDAAVAAIATNPNLINANPEVAMSWAESLVSREARLQAIEDVVQQWASRNDTAARRYVETSPGLDLQERTELLALLNHARERQ